MHSKSVIIVDDTMDIARLLRTVLISVDPTLKISLVPSAEEAILESTRTPIDLLVTDIRLPGMTGFELVKKIRTRYPDVRTLIVTGLTESRIGLEARALGIETVLNKPLDMDAFRKAACRYLDIELSPEGSSVASPALSRTPANQPDLNREDVQRLLDRIRDKVGAEAAACIDVDGNAWAGSGAALDWAAWLRTVPALHRALSGPKEAPFDHVTLVRSGALDFAICKLAGIGLIMALKPGRTTARLLAAAGELLELPAKLAGLSGVHPDGGVGLENGPTAEPPADQKGSAPGASQLPPETHFEFVNEDNRLDMDEENPAGLANLLQQLNRPINKEEAEQFWASAWTDPGPRSGHDSNTSGEID